jgi:hypothetical protein
MAELTSAMLHDAANALLTLDADAAHSKSRQHAGRFSVRESTLIAACRRDSTHGCQRFDAVWGTERLGEHRRSRLLRFRRPPPWNRIDPNRE